MITPVFQVRKPGRQRRGVPFPSSASREGAAPGSSPARALLTSRGGRKEATRDTGPMAVAAAFAYWDGGMLSADRAWSKEGSRNGGFAPLQRRVLSLVRKHLTFPGTPPRRTITTGLEPRRHLVESSLSGAWLLSTHPRPRCPSVSGRQWSLKRKSPPPWHLPQHGRAAASAATFLFFSRLPFPAAATEGAAGTCFMNAFSLPWIKSDP